SRQYRGWSLRAHRGGIGGRETGTAQCHGGRGSRQDVRRGRMRRTVTHHGSDDQRDRTLNLVNDVERNRPAVCFASVLEPLKIGNLILLETAVDVQEVRKLDAYLKRL